MEYMRNVTPELSVANDVSLHELLRIFVRYRWTVVSFAAVVVGAATLAAALMKPVYRASVVISPAEAPKSLGALGSIASQFGGLAGLNLAGSDRLKEEALAILQSQAFTERFISEHKLLPKLFADRWDERAQKWSVPQAEIPTPTNGYKLFDDEIRSVAQDQLTGLITISIEHGDRTVVAQWANLLVQDLNAFISRRAIAEAEQSLRYLNEELNRTDGLELRAGITKLIEQQLQEIMLANVRHEYVFRIVDPAMQPEKKSYVRPRRLFMISGAVLIGLMLGLLVALARNAFSAADAAQPAHQ
jgi:uncharacterized protein involved in exopolysaccharide biosynthesis